MPLSWPHTVQCPLARRVATRPRACLESRASRNRFVGSPCQLTKDGRGFYVNLSVKSR
jgi:hypothetical protein